MEKIINNKKTLIIVIAIVALIGIIFLVKGCSADSDKINDLSISYSKEKEISFNDFSKKFNNERTITVKNTSSQNKTYSLEWSDVKNTLKKQNVFLYEISCKGNNCATLGKSQVPVAAAQVFPQVAIKPGDKQEYTVKFTYSGSEKDVSFKGSLVVKSKKVDEKKIEELKKAQQDSIKKADEAAKAKEEANSKKGN